MSTCPVTHLTVAVHPAWTKEHKKAGYTKVIQRIGQDILLAAITADRDVTLDTLDNDLLQKVTQEPGYSQEHLYLLWDMTHVINLSSTYKKETASIIYNPGNPFKAIIFYNVDSRARTLTETFAAIVQDTIPVYIQEHTLKQSPQSRSSKTAQRHHMATRILPGPGRPPKSGSSWPSWAG